MRARYGTVTPWLGRAALAAMLAGCAGSGAVVRVEDGRALPGRFVGAEAYAAFLRGSLADEQGDARGALGGYEAAAEADPADPEVWTRVAWARCRLDPSDKRIQSALLRASGYPPADAVQRSCERLRRGGREDGTHASTPEVVSVAPPAAGETQHRQSAEGRAAERARLEELTLLHADRVAAWEALATWGTTHGDPALAAHAWAGVARRSATRRLELGRSAMKLAGDGHVVAGEALAAALVDGDGDRSSGGESPAAASVPLVARLALDEALLRRDASRARARSVRAHLGLEVAAARAWGMGDASLARDLIAPVVRADPGDVGARLVLEGAAGRATTRLLPSALPSGDINRPTRRLAPDAMLPFARAVLVSEGVEAARRAMAFSADLDEITGDSLLVAAAVDLAVAGVLSDAELPPDARIELALRRGLPPAGADVAATNLDARHRILALAVLRPTDPTTLAEVERLSAASGEDALVAVARVKLALARGEVVPPQARARLEATAAADPISAATLVQLTRREGSSPSLARARGSLAAVARTPAERAAATD